MYFFYFLLLLLLLFKMNKKLIFFFYLMYKSGTKEIKKKNFVKLKYYPRVQILLGWIHLSERTSMRKSSTMSSKCVKIKCVILITNDFQIYLVLIDPHWVTIFFCQAILLMSSNLVYIIILKNIDSNYFFLGKETIWKSVIWNFISWFISFFLASH